MIRLKEILRKARIERNLSQENVANDLGMSLTGYAKIERGETDVNFSRLQKIAEYYEMDVVQLLNTGRVTKEQKMEMLKAEDIVRFKEMIALLEKTIAQLNEQWNTQKKKKRK